MARQLPAGVVSVRQWCYGELEFDALMRQLDNAVSSIYLRCKTLRWTEVAYMQFS